MVTVADYTDIHKHVDVQGKRVPFDGSQHVHRPTLEAYARPWGSFNRSDDGHLTVAAAELTTTETLSLQLHRQ